MLTVFLSRRRTLFLLAMLTLFALRGPCQSLPAKPTAEMGFVTGTVYYADTNLPARVAQVNLDPWPSKDSGSRHSGAFTDLDGRFRSPGVPPGQYVVSADVGGYLQISPQLLDDPSVRDSPEAKRNIEARFTIVTVVANQAANVNLSIERGAEIRGIVLYDDGSPAVGLTITFGRKESQAKSADRTPNLFPGPAGWEPYTRTDDRGQFRIHGLFPGLYQLSVVVPTYSAADPPDGFFTYNLDNVAGALRIFADGSFEPSRSQGVRIKDSDREKDVNITIPLSSLHTVSGQIVLKGLDIAPPGAAIQLLYADTRELARAGVARDGDLELHDVPEGNYILRVAASSLAPTMHSCPPDCQPPTPAVFGDSAEVPLIVTGDVSNLVVAVPPPPGAAQ